MLLHFEGAGQKTQAYIFTSLVGSHTGGYDEFTFDITDDVNNFTVNKLFNGQFSGKISLSVRCDNTRDLEMIPSDLSDFNLYGGLYRYLNLEYVPSFYIERIFTRAVPDTEGKTGSVIVSAILAVKSDIKSGTAKIKIYAPDNKIVASSSIPVEQFSGEKDLISFTIKKPLLWSPDKPFMYKCEIILKSSAGEQKVIENFGFRNFEFVKKGPSGVVHFARTMLM
jgi:beta-galactosidase